MGSMMHVAIQAADGIITLRHTEKWLEALAVSASGSRDFGGLGLDRDAVTIRRFMHRQR